MANIITGCRVILSIGLLFVPLLSPVFYIFYLLAGFTDMIDGTVARMTHTDSEFGAKLDTVAAVHEMYYVGIKKITCISKEEMDCNG